MPGSRARSPSSLDAPIELSSLSEYPLSCVRSPVAHMFSSSSFSYGYIDYIPQEGLRSNSSAHANSRLLSMYSFSPSHSLSLSFSVPLTPTPLSSVVFCSIALVALCYPGSLACYACTNISRSHSSLLCIDVTAQGHGPHNITSSSRLVSPPRWGTIYTTAVSLLMPCHAITFPAGQCLQKQTVIDYHFPRSH